MINELLRLARQHLDSRERRRAARWLVGPIVVVARWAFSRDNVVLTEIETTIPDRPAPTLIALPDGADATSLMTGLRSDPNRHCPVELGHFESNDGRITLDAGRNLVVESTGPYHGPVRVVAADDEHVRIQTRVDHLEAGQSEFRFESMATDGLLAGTEPGDLVFLVESWSRSADPFMDRIYRAGPGAAAQRYLWVHLCRSVAAEAGRSGATVHVLTEWLPPLPRLAGEADASTGPERSHA